MTRLCITLGLVVSLAPSCTWFSPEVEEVCSKGLTVEVHKVGKPCGCNPKYIVSPPIGYSFAPEFPPRTEPTHINQFYTTSATDDN